MLGDNFILYKFFYNFVPSFDKFRFVARFKLMFMFSFSLLGAYGFNYFMSNANGEKVKKFIKGFIILVSGFIVLWLLFQFGLFKNMIDVYKDETIYDNSTFQLLKTVITLLALLALVIVYKKKIIFQQIVLFFIILFAFTDLYIFGTQHNNDPGSPEGIYVNKGVVAIIKQEYNHELFRITSRTKENIHVFHMDNQGMIDFIFIQNGYTPLALKNRFPPYRTNDIMNVKYIAVVDTVTLIRRFEQNKNYMPRTWVSYYPIIEPSLGNVAKILEDSTFDIRRKVIIDQEPNIFIDTNTLIVDDYKSDIISYKINEITLSVTTTQNGILVLSEVYYPNWKVFVDDVEKPMLRADYSLRAVVIEKGTHTVIFKYVDKDFQLGAIITLFALAMVIGGFVISGYKKTIL